MSLKKCLGADNLVNFYLDQQQLFSAQQFMYL